MEVVVGDLSRDAGLAPALEGIRCVYHLARSSVKTWEEYVEHEIEATRRVAEACLAAKVGRLIYTGTIDSYYAGAKAGTITEETPLDPHIDWRNYYGRAKAISEQLLMESHQEKGLPVVIFRPGIVIGRGSNPLHWGVGMWSFDAVCQVWGRGRNPLPLVLVEDVASALVTALDVPNLEGESFNLVAGSGLTAFDYLEALDRSIGADFQKIPTSPWKFYLADLAKWLVKRGDSPSRPPASQLSRLGDTDPTRTLRLLEGPQGPQLESRGRPGGAHPKGNSGAGAGVLRLRLVARIRGVPRACWIRSHEFLNSLPDHKINLAKSPRRKIRWHPSGRYVNRTISAVENR